MANSSHVCNRNGRWYADVHIQGRRIRRVAGAKRQDAVDLARLLLAEQSVHDLRVMKAKQKGEAPPPRQTLELALEDAFHDYRRSLVSRGIKQTSREFLDGKENVLSRAFGERYNLLELTVGTLERYVAARRKEVMVPTINGDLGALTAVLKYAVKTGRIAEMPLHIAKLPTTRQLPYALQKSDLDKLLAHASPPFDLMLLIAARAGLRQQEILHLQRRDVVLNGSDPELRVTAKPEVGWQPKNYQERSVPIKPTGDLHAAFRQHLDRMEDADLNAWLFMGHEGTKRATAHGPIRKIFKAAGMYRPEQKPGLHALRRTFATSLLQRKGDLETVRQLGGWADLATVQRYLGSNSETKQNAIATLD